MQWLLVHGAARDSIARAPLGARVGLKPPLEHGHNGALASAYRPHEQQNALADFEALGSRVEVFHHLLKRFLEAIYLVSKEQVLWNATLTCFHPADITMSK